MQEEHLIIQAPYIGGKLEEYMNNIPYTGAIHWREDGGITSQYTVPIHWSKTGGMTSHYSGDTHWRKARGIIFIIQATHMGEKQRE
jgi:hypothetical protein